MTVKNENTDVGFLYCNGKTNRGSYLRGDEGLFSLVSALTNGFNEKTIKDRAIPCREIFDIFLKAVKSEELIIPPAFFNRIARERNRVGCPGAEHEVFGDAQSNRVIKITHPDEIGDGGIAGKGTVMDYFISILLSKELFGVGTRFEGVVELGGQTPRIVTSQPWFKGKSASVKDIKKDLEKRGFSRADGTKGGNLWEHKNLGLRIYDAVPENVFKGEGGGLYYYDVDVSTTKPLRESLNNIHKMNVGGTSITSQPKLQKGGLVEAKERTRMENQKG